MIKRNHIALSFVLALSVLALPPALADEYLVFHEAGLPNSADIWTWCHENAINPADPCFFTPVTNCATPEGNNHLSAVSNEWVGFGIFFLDFSVVPPANTITEDFSNYANGEIRFWVNSGHELNIEFQCLGVGQLQNLTGHGWDGTPTWQEIVIPIADFFAPNPVNMTCLQDVNAPFLATGANIPTNFKIDHVRWRTSNSHSGASQVEVQGRQLMVNGEPFVVNGIAYNPISVGEDFHGALRDRPDRYNVDFPLMAASGINTVRVYNTQLSTQMLDAAWANGLRVIPTIAINPGQLECPEGRAYMHDRVVETVNHLKDHPAILYWLLGNETNTNPATTSLCDATMGWFPMLDSLAEAAHLAEDPTYPAGNSYHPVSTANAEMGDICMTGCSDDTALPHVDLWGTQIYRGCNLFNSTFTDYAAKSDCNRPLVVTEFGVDSWDSLSGATGAENQAMQSTCFDTMLGFADDALAVRTAGGVSSGQVVFSWSDEWWKANCDPGTAWNTHDTCESWNQPGYPDPSINEEWWGLVTVDDVDPNVRVNRAAQGTVADTWRPGAVCNMSVDSYDSTSGATTISFDPAPGSTDHSVYYGPLNTVSSYGYTGSATVLGADGTSSLTLSDPGSLFWLVVGRTNSTEGHYGTGLAERPASPGAAVPQDANRTGLCSTP